MNSLSSMALESHCTAGTLAPGAAQFLCRHVRQPAAVPRTVCMAQQAPARADQGYQVQESETYLGCAFWLVCTVKALLELQQAYRCCSWPVCVLRPELPAGRRRAWCYITSA